MMLIGTILGSKNVNTLNEHKMNLLLNIHCLIINSETPKYREKEGEAIS